MKYIVNARTEEKYINYISGLFEVTKSEAARILAIDEKLNNDLSEAEQLDRLENYFKSLDYNAGKEWQRYYKDFINVFTPAYNEWINNK